MRKIFILAPTLGKLPSRPRRLPFPHFSRRPFLPLVLLVLLGISAAVPIPAQARLVFTFPECLPDCSRDDMRSHLNAGETEGLFIEAIDAAQRHLSFAMYTFSRQAVLSALVRAAQRQIKIRGIVDAAQLASLKPFCQAGVCKFGAPFDDASYPGLSVEQKLALIANLPLYQKASRAAQLSLLFHGSKHADGDDLVRLQAPGGQRLMHHKYLLVDERSLLTGSGNWSSTAFGINYENIAILDGNKPEEAAAVEAFACTSRLLGAKERSPHLLQAVAACQVPEQVYFTPAQSAGGISERILAAIASSQHSIAISMHHLVYEPIYQALSQAVQRGVSLRLLFDDDDCLRKTDPAVKGLMALSDTRVMVRYLPTNCELFQFSHSKYGVFDDKLVINGSANWSKAGLLRNFENFMLYKDEAQTREFRENFERLWAFAKPKPECGCNLREASCRSRFCIGRPRP